MRRGPAGLQRVSIAPSVPVGRKLGGGGNCLALPDRGEGRDHVTLYLMTAGTSLALLDLGISYGLVSLSQPAEE